MKFWTSAVTETLNTINPVFNIPPVKFWTFAVTLTLKLNTANPVFSQDSPAYVNVPSSK